MANKTISNHDIFTADTDGNYYTNRPVSERELFDFICKLLEQRLYRTDVITCPEDTRNFLIAKLGIREAEVFATMFLDNRHRVIAYEEMFFGTINGASA